MRKIGYVRVSSVDQNPKRQLQQMKEFEVNIIYEEKVSGATQNRPELQNMLNDLREGDTIYVTDLTRITRSTRDLFELVDYLNYSPL
ncbi:recombinase family protein, partial [Bacillus toyonensis]|uniref:recombinase family protein n=1 Tax=Bacillus toyonensis TaxID=155322 RepID=UPI000C002101